MPPREPYELTSPIKYNEAAPTVTHIEFTTPRGMDAQYVFDTFNAMRKMNAGTDNAKVVVERTLNFVELFGIPVGQADKVAMSALLNHLDAADIWQIALYVCTNFMPARGSTEMM